MSRIELARVNVERVLKAIGLEVVTRDGTELLAKCPSGRHVDNKPSWHIKDDPTSDKHAIFGCWSCGFSGNAISLVHDVLDIGWSSAEEYIRERAYEGELPSATEIRLEVADLTRRAFRVPEGVIFDPLEKWLPSARTYVTKTRHITAEQIARWGIGYSIEGSLSGRIIIPTRNAQGDAVNYTGRTFTGQEPRYKNARKDESPDPAVLFGEMHWRGPGAPRDHAVVVEGALNGLAVERACPEVAIAAIGGTKSLHPLHLLKLARFKHVTILTDPDIAGDMVAVVIADALERHVQVRRVRLAEKTDADSIPSEELRCHLAIPS